MIENVIGFLRENWMVPILIVFATYYLFNLLRDYIRLDKVKKEESRLKNELTELNRKLDVETTKLEKEKAEAMDLLKKMYGKK